MDFGFTTAAYVVAAVLFILSLGGLSGQESAKRAVWYGIVGMALAVVATLIGPGSGLWLLSLVLIAAGGAIGYYVAQRVQMTEMPELVAAMHSLVGLAAVFVGFNADITILAVDAAKAAGETVSGSFAELVYKKTPVETTILMVELALAATRGIIIPGMRRLAPDHTLDLVAGQRLVFQQPLRQALQVVAQPVDPGQVVLYLEAAR